MTVNMTKRTEEACNMTRRFYPGHQLVADGSRRVIARGKLRALAEHVKEIQEWSPTAGKFVEDLCARMAVQGDRCTVTPKMLAWIDKLHRIFVEEKTNGRQQE